MGAWGPGLFSDDVACDVRGDFRDLIGDGLTAEEATGRILEEYPSREDDPDDGSVVIIALAMTQWKTGRLLDEVRDKAIAAIDNGADLERWSDDPKLLWSRSEVLRKARSQLLSPQRSPTRIPRRVRSSTPFRSGDVIIHHHDSGSQFVFWVSGNMADKGGTYTSVELLDVNAAAVASSPGLVVDASPRLRHAPSPGRSQLAVGYLLLDCQNYAPDRYFVVGRVDRPGDRLGHELRAIRVKPPSKRSTAVDKSLDRQLDQFV